MSNMSKSTKGLRLRQLDKELLCYKGLPVLNGSCIREIREALGMSSTQLAQRMGVHQSTVIRMEESEKDETISIDTLNRAARALGCRLVYALVPETSLAQTIRDQAQHKAITETGSVFHSMGLEQQSTEKESKEELIEELTQKFIQKGGRQLWT
jgi:predicted DNA-binding mobile mystery protein A